MSETSARIYFGFTNKLVESMFVFDKRACKNKTSEDGTEIQYLHFNYSCRLVVINNCEYIIIIILWKLASKLSTRVKIDVKINYAWRLKRDSYAHMFYFMRMTNILNFFSMPKNHFCEGKKENR
jgi:hypothetical protein